MTSDPRHLLRSASGDVAACEDSDHCITCGDVAEPMRVLRVDERRELALCEDEGGEHRTVEIALVAPVSEGDQLLVHAGTAIGHNTPGRVAEEVLR